MNPTKVRALAVFFAASLAVPVAALGQARLGVYTDVFAGGSAAPGSAQRGTDIDVDVPVIEELEDQTTALEQRMAAHLADSGAHQPHGHPHTHCPPGTREASLVRPGLPGEPGDETVEVEFAEAQDGDSHCEIMRLLGAVIELMMPLANAQAPPPMVVYDPDMGGPSQDAPVTPRTNLEAELAVDLPLIDQIRALIAELDEAIATHVAARPGHAHGHPHKH